MQGEPWPVEALPILDLAETFGFSAAKTGGHMARSMMLPDLTQLLRSVAAGATKEVCKDAVVNENVLGEVDFFQP